MEPNRADERIALRLYGRVQGVGFRWWTLQAARRLGVRGTVRNRPDGSVEIQAAAQPEVLSLFLEAVRRGSPAARVAGEEEIPFASPLPPDFRVIG
jgi:acylphosphatase